MVKDADQRTVLRDWYLLPQGTGNPRICGMAPKADKDGVEHTQRVTAGRVLKRVSKSVIETSSGSHYKLDGPIDTALMKQNGFSASFAQIFRLGFPTNWEYLLKDEMDRIVSSEPTRSNFAVPVTPKPIKKPKPSRKPPAPKKAIPVTPKPVKNNRRPKSSRKPPTAKKSTLKKITKKRTVKWFKNTLDAVAKIPSARKRAAAVLFTPVSEQPTQLPQADWSDTIMDDDFTPVTFADTTRTFRMSAGRRSARDSGQGPLVPTNAANAANRLNFQGFLEQEKNQQKKRKNVAGVSRNESVWSRNESIQSSRREFGKKLEIPALPEEDV